MGLVLGPGPIHDMIETFSAVGWMFLRRMRREVAEAGPDERLQEILERAENYMKDVPDDAEAFFRQDAQLSWTRSLPGSGNPCRLADTQPERSPRCTPSCLFAKVP